MSEAEDIYQRLAAAKARQVKESAQEQLMARLARLMDNAPPFDALVTLQAQQATVILEASGGDEAAAVELAKHVSESLFTLLQAFFDRARGDADAGQGDRVVN
jgi:hypothetical protein